VPGRASGARLSFLADLLSRPVLIGCLTGVALIMMVDQLPKLTGVRTTGAQFFPQLWALIRELSDAHAATVILSLAAIAFLFTVPRRVPGPLAALALTLASLVAFDLDDRCGIKVIGEIPSGLPGLASPDLSEVPRLVLPALGVLVASVRSVADRVIGQPVLSLIRNVGRGRLTSPCDSLRGGATGCRRSSRRCRAARRTARMAHGPATARGTGWHW
jgi:hypothetical protein